MKGELGCLGDVQCNLIGTNEQICSDTALNEWQRCSERKD